MPQSKKDAVPVLGLRPVSGSMDCPSRNGAAAGEGKGACRVGRLRTGPPPAWRAEEGRARGGGRSSARGWTERGEAFQGAGPAWAKAWRLFEGPTCSPAKQVGGGGEVRVFSSWLGNLDLPRDWEPRKVFAHRREEAKGLELAKARQGGEPGRQQTPLQEGEGQAEDSAPLWIPIHLNWP